MTKEEFLQLQELQRKHPIKSTIPNITKAAYPTIGIAALVMFGIVYFIGCLHLSAIERAKIDCAEKLFNTISTSNVKYHKVATFQDLIDGMNAIS